VIEDDDLRTAKGLALGLVLVLVAYGLLFALVWG
jgi:hypothetical protein